MTGVTSLFVAARLGRPLSAVWHPCLTYYLSAHAIDAILLHKAEGLEEAALQVGTMAAAQAEQEHLQRLYDVLDTFRIIVRLDEHGEPLRTVPPTLDGGGWALASDPEIASAVREGQTVILHPRPSGSDSAPFAVVAPLKDRSGSLKGFLAGELDVSEDHLELVPRAILSERATAFLVDDRGDIIAQAGGQS